jgi:hypothetical protein
VEVVPTVRLDGSRESVGGQGGCTGHYNAYRTLYEQRMSETSGTSPVEITGCFSVFEGMGSIRADFRLLDPVSLGQVRATLFLYEDDITWCCGYGGEDHWDQIVRIIEDETVTNLLNPGDQCSVSKEIIIPSGWNPANFHAVAILQKTTGNKEIVQAARLTSVVDFALTVPRRVGSVPVGNGEEIFPATVRNVGGAADVLTLAVDSAMEWPADLRIGGEQDWHSSLPVPLAPGDSVGISIRVRTDDRKRIGSGTFSVTSANSGRTHPAALRVFNGSHAVLFVDDDAGQTWGTGGPTCDAPFVAALDSLGYLYENWEVLNQLAGATPPARHMYGFDTVIWETGLEFGGVNSGDCANLARYLDNGGSLFMSGMDLLTGMAAPESFVHDYLGVASWEHNTMCHTASGVAQDPITGGMVLLLTWPEGDQLNRVDTTNPGPNAVAILFSETGDPNVVRFARENFRVVFSTIIQNAISSTAPAPNNSQTLIQRALAWLTGPEPAATEPASVPGTTPIVRFERNPSSPPARIVIRVVGCGEAIRLAMFDASGRRVRTLIDRMLAPGAHRVTWDGRDEEGRPAPAGVYFARLHSRQGETSRKLVLTR